MEHIEQKDDIKTIPLGECENHSKIKPRTNRSTLRFSGDTYYTLYTETKFNWLQKKLWKYLLNIDIQDIKED